MHFHGDGSTPSGANAPAPPRGSLWVLPQTFPPPLKAVPLRADFPRPGEDVAQRQKGECGIAAGDDGRGNHRQRRFLRKRQRCGGSAAWRKRAEPSPSLLRKSTSPERGRFCSTYRQMHKSSPFGGAGRDQRERTERVRSSAASFPFCLLTFPCGSTTIRNKRSCPLQHPGSFPPWQAAFFICRNRCAGQQT